MMMLEQWRCVVYRGGLVMDGVDRNDRVHDKRGRFAGNGLTAEVATMSRQASTFSEARQAALAFQGKPIENRKTKMTAVVSRNNLDKMLSRKAVEKSETPALHCLAVANLDHLFEQAIHGWSKPDRSDDQNIRAIHRFFAPMLTGKKALLVKLTVKETAQLDRSNSMYTVEAVQFNEVSPAALWVGEIVSADGVDPRTILSVRDVVILAEDVQKLQEGFDDK